MKNLLAYFIRGLLLTVPLAVTIFVIVWVFQFVDGLLPVDFPGLGLLIILAAITLVGVIGSTIIAKPFLNYLEKAVQRTPIVKIIYFSVKDLLDAFVSGKKKFGRPVLVKLSHEADIYKVGFITQEKLPEFDFEEEMVSVYLPHSYNFSGNHFLVPRKNITPLDYSSTEVMKYVVSGGISKIDTKKKPDKEDEAAS